MLVFMAVAMAMATVAVAVCACTSSTSTSTSTSGVVALQHEGCALEYCNYSAVTSCPRHPEVLLCIHHREACPRCEARMMEEQAAHDARIKKIAEAKGAFDNHLIYYPFESLLYFATQGATAGLYLFILGHMFVLCRVPSSLASAFLPLMIVLPLYMVTSALIHGLMGMIMVVPPTEWLFIDKRGV